MRSLGISALQGGEVQAASSGTDPILKTILFTIVVPGFVTVGAPYLLLGGFPARGRSPLAWLGLLCIVIGASIYFATS